MPDLADGDVHHVQGSAKAPYELKNVGGVYSCSCPAWRNAGGAIDRRTCKHLKSFRGAAAEAARIGAAGADIAPSAPSAAAADDAESAPSGVTAPPVLLAHRWDNDVDLAGWWMSEKLDGVRAWWDGTRFLSRLGNPFFAPAWFTAGLPAHPLDGELWVGRKEFSRCISIVRSAGTSEAWRDVRYVVFDAPHVTGAFEQRIAFVDALLGEAREGGAHPYAQPHVHVRCESTAHLRAELARVEALGGEGLMLREPGSAYVDGRSTTLLKVKTFHDAEGRVVAHEGGKGKHKGRLGALVVEMPNGTRFNVGTGFSDAEREAPPAVGAIVTYRYQELTKDGVPRFPSYVGLAIDKASPTIPVPSAAVALTAPLSPPDAAATAAAFREAVHARRWDEVEALFDVACVVSGAHGDAVGRAAALSALRAEADAVRVVRVVGGDVRVDCWGKTAVCTARSEVTAVVEGKPLRRAARETVVLTQASGAWHVAWRRLDEEP